jgi:NAD(P)-dependent dehydrogenase (short-subunit alcohol dehydrogenase family)
VQLGERRAYEVKQRGRRSALRPPDERDFESKDSEVGRDGRGWLWDGAIFQGGRDRGDVTGVFESLSLLQFAVTVDDRPPASIELVPFRRLGGRKGVQGGSDHLEGGRVQWGVRDGLGENIVVSLLASEENFSLVGEVSKERGLGEARTLGDLNDPGLVVALLFEQLESRFDETYPRIGLPAGHGPERTDVPKYRHVVGSGRYLVTSLSWRRDDLIGRNIVRILVTGASGHIGSAVVTDLLKAGHDVVGLARSDASADVVRRLGAEALRGDVTDLDLLRDAVSNASATIHLAFDNQAALDGDLAGASESDLAVVRAFGDALAGTDKAFLAVGIGPTGDEQLDAIVRQNPRSAVPRAIAGFADQGIRSVLVAIPPVVHSPRDKIGFIPTLINIARNTGISAYVAEGANCWPAVHTLDLSRLWAAAEDTVSTRQIVETIARHLDLPSSSVSIEQSEAHFGGFAPIMALDFPTMTNPETQELFGWQPDHPGLIEDLETGYYFAQAEV